MCVCERELNTEGEIDKFYRFIFITKKCLLLQMLKDHLK